jgi:hypothetical protein
MNEPLTRIGVHPAAIEGDCLFVKWTGALVESDIDDMFSRAYAIMRERGHVFVRIDASEGTDVKPAARKHILSFSSEPPFTATAIHGARFQTRVLANLIVNAVNMFRKEKFTVLICDEEAEARRWIEDRRNEVAKK